MGLVRRNAACSHGARGRFATGMSAVLRIRFDGALLVSDDTNGAIYRVAHEKHGATAHVIDDLDQVIGIGLQRCVLWKS